MSTKKSISERMSSSLFHLVYETVGAASTCWEKPEFAGIFNDKRASELAHQLCEAVADELHKDRRPVSFKVYIEPKNGKAGFWFSSNGTFIQWANSFVEFHVGPGNMTVALVENEDGQVFKVEPSDIQFMDVPGAVRNNQDLRNEENQIPGREVRELNQEEVKELFKNDGTKELHHAWQSGLCTPPIGKIVEARWLGTNRTDITDHDTFPVYYIAANCFRHSNRVDLTYAINEIEWRFNPKFDQ